MELISTERLWGFPMTASEITDYIRPEASFGQSRGLVASERPLTSEVIELFAQGILPLLDTMPNEDHVWYTAWCIVERANHQPIGDFCFYAPPQEEGWVECGYGIYPAFQRQGYMTEFMQGVLVWCRAFPRVKSLRARTEPSNVPSNRMLERLGFDLTGEDSEGNLFWENVICRVKESS